MTVLSKINEANFFKELPFYNSFIEKPEIKRLTNINLLAELPFHDQLSVIKTDQAFSGYARSYKIEIVEKIDPILQLETSKLSAKDLFIALINEMNGFKYQITVKVLLKKYKPNGEIEFVPVYFNSSTKLVKNHRYKLNKSCQEILYRIDAWINKGSGWIIESIESQYINITTYMPLAGLSYIDLPIELRSPRKRLINIKSNDQKCFLWCHARHINSTQEHPGRIKKTDKRIASNLNYEGIEFPVQEKDFSKTEVQNNISINAFGYENELVYPIFISKQKFEDSMDLLQVYEDDKSHYVYIRDFDTFIFHKTKNKNKKWFFKSC